MVREQRSYKLGAMAKKLKKKFAVEVKGILPLCKLVMTVLSCS